MKNIEDALSFKITSYIRPSLTKEQEDTIMQKFRFAWTYHSCSIEGKNELRIDIHLILEEAHPIVRLKVGGRKAIQHIYDYESPIVKELSPIAF